MHNSGAIGGLRGAVQSRIPALIAALVIAADAAAQEPEPGTETQRFQDWAVRCEARPQDQPQACVMFQRVNIDPEKTILAINVVFVSGRSRLIYTVPLGVALNSGMSIVVENRYGKTHEDELEYSHCNSRGCFVHQTLDEELLGYLKRGRTLNVVFSNLQNQTLNVPASLQGFTDGFEALRRRSIAGSM